jgi:L-lactate permease
MGYNNYLSILLGITAVIVIFIMLPFHYTSANIVGLIGLLVTVIIAMMNFKPQLMQSFYPAGRNHRLIPNHLGCC